MVRLLSATGLALWLSFAFAGCVPLPSRFHVTAAPPRDVGLRAVRAFFSAYDTGDVHTFVRVLREELSERVPRDEAKLAARYADLQRQFGKLALRDVAFDEHTVRAIAQSEREGWLRFDFFFEAAAPHKLTGQRVRPTAEPEATRHGDEALAATLRAYVQDRSVRGLFAGDVLVARADRVLFDEAFGDAEPNTTHKRFAVASVTKMFTAVAVAQIVERGLMRFDAPIERYLPDYPQPFAHEITVAMLLSHTSGLGDHVGHGYEQHPGAYREPEDFVRVWSHDAPSFRPGTHFQYSNFGFIVLGRIIERVGGQSYADYIEQHVFAPAGMTESSMRAASQLAAPPASPVEIIPNPAGNAWCTTTDLLHFARALHDDRLVSASTRQTLFTPRHAVEGGGALGETYAFGFILSGSPQTPRIGHGGEAPGRNAFFEILPSQAAVVIVLSNLNPPAASWVGERIVHWLAPGEDGGD